MPRLRFSLRTVMILIFAAGLALATWHEVERMDPIAWQRTRQGLILVVPVLIVIALKYALICGMRVKRGRSDDSPGSSPPLDPLP